MKIIAASAHQKGNESQNIIELPNDADPLALDLTGVARIDLHFPKFSDGRAFSQARLLRGRLKFTGEIRATGDVLIDQLVQMARCGFDVAVLREGVITDNGGCIVDVKGLSITDPLAMEQEVNQWPGVVTVGIFARHRASVCLLGTAQGVKTLSF